jgi:hypothetical protein
LIIAEDKQLVLDDGAAQCATEVVPAGNWTSYAFEIVGPGVSPDFSPIYRVAEK